MFTGIIEEVGEVQAVVDLGDSKRVTVRGPLVVSDAKIGDSIQVSGVCLTVAQRTSSTFTADVMRQTLLKSTLKDLAPGTKVNLERAVRADTRLGGHIVQGHVDGIARVNAVTNAEHWRIIRFDLDTELAMMLVPQGSITVSGVSLTVSNLSEAHQENQWFEVSLIPETLSATTLGSLKSGDLANIETDVIARHVARMLAFKRK